MSIGRIILVALVIWTGLLVVGAIVGLVVAYYG